VNLRRKKLYFALVVSAAVALTALDATVIAKY
jgi:hypothetical protein